MTSAVTFTFRPQWKEELSCACELGEVILDMPMGVTSVYVPHQQTWEAEAPAWALPHWETFNEQLSAWCDEHNIPLYPGVGCAYFKVANGNGRADVSRRHSG